MKNKYQNIIILIILSSLGVKSQTLNYAEDGRWGRAYPYKDYPPKVQTVRYFSLIHQYLLKDDYSTAMPSSNIINLEDSYFTGKKFYLNIEDGWWFQSIDQNLEIELEDIRYSIDKASEHLGALQKNEINSKTIKIISSANDNFLLLNTKAPLSKADSSDICNALRKVILIPSGCCDTKDEIDLYNKKPLTAGSFYISKKAKIMHLSSENTKYYLEGDPLIKDIYFQFIIKYKQPGKLDGNKIDIILDGNVFHKRQMCGDYFCKTIASDNLHILYINHRNAKMQQLDFRQALEYAIDKDVLAKVYEGKKLLGPLSSRSYYRNKNLKSHPHDIEKAKHLLESLGYFLKKGMYNNPSTGMPVEIKILFDKNEDDIVVDNIRAYLKKVGISVKRIALEKPALKKLLREKSKDEWDLYYSTERMESSQFIRSYFHSEATNQKNWGGYQNYNIDLLFDLFKASDGTQKSKLSPEIHEYLYEDVAVIGLFVNPTWAIYRKTLQPLIVPYYYFDQPHKWRNDKE